MGKVVEQKNSKWQELAYRIWAIVGICILVGVVIYIAGILWQAVATIVLSAFIVFILHGIVNFFERKGMPRWGGTTIAVVGLLVVVVGCIIALIPAVVSQLSSLLANLPAYTASIEQLVSDVLASLGNHTSGGNISTLIDQATSWLQSNVGTAISRTAGGVMGGVMSLGNALLIFFISLLVSYWILLDLPKIAHEVRSLFVDKYQDDIDIIGDAFGNAVYGWARSTILCAILAGVVTGLVLWPLGVPYAGLLGLVCGILYVIPYLGAALSCIVVGVVALFVSPVLCVVSAIVVIVLHNIISNAVSPKLMGSAVNVHPAIILVVILVGGALGGAFGMLLSIPVAATIQGVFITYYERRTGRSLASEDGAFFRKKPESNILRRGRKTRDVRRNSKRRRPAQR